MLRDTHRDVIRPTHDTLDRRSAALEEAASTLCDGEPTSSELEAARTAWTDLQGPLKHVRAWSFNMSPYRGKEFDVLFYKIDDTPAFGDNIEAVVTREGTYRKDRNRDGDDRPDEPFAGTSDASIDTEFIANQDYRRHAKGFPAVEYLLFGSPDDTNMLELYTSGEHASRRCDYLTAAAAHADGVVDSYVEAWSSDGGDFGARFTGPTSDDMDWTNVQDSINAMVSQMVFVSKDVLSKREIGGPMGQHADNPNIPNEVASPYANHSLSLLQANLKGLERIYSGGGGKSLADFTKFRKASVHQLVQTRISEARSAIDAVPTPLSKAVDNSPEKVEAAQTAIDELAQAIESDLKTTLGASTTKVVVDND
jgi:predicted lipoprotein